MLVRKTTAGSLVISKVLSTQYLQIYEHTYFLTCHLEDFILLLKYQCKGEEKKVTTFIWDPNGFENIFGVVYSWFTVPPGKPYKWYMSALFRALSVERLGHSIQTDLGKRIYWLTNREA